MATFQVASPSSFNFARPEEWPEWFKRFELHVFKQASGLAAKSEESQINTLIYIMGSKADDILQSFNLSDEDQKKYDTVVTHFMIISLFAETLFLRELNLTLVYKKMVNQQTHLSLPCMV